MNHIALRQLPAGLAATVLVVGVQIPAGDVDQPGGPAALPGGGNHQMCSLSANIAGSRVYPALS
ncbi:hypothetical protein ACXDF8_17795 [Mycolicibacterium sp. CBM1]